MDVITVLGWGEVEGDEDSEVDFGEFDENFLVKLFENVSFKVDVSILIILRLLNESLGISLNNVVDFSVNCLSLRCLIEVSPLPIILTTNLIVT